MSVGEPSFIGRGVKIVTVCMVIGVMEWRSVHDYVYKYFTELDMLEIVVGFLDNVCDYEPS